MILHIHFIYMYILVYLHIYFFCIPIERSLSSPTNQELTFFIQATDLPCVYSGMLVIGIYIKRALTKAGRLEISQITHVENN